MYYQNDLEIFFHLIFNLISYSWFTILATSIMYIRCIWARFHADKKVTHPHNKCSFEEKHYWNNKYKTDLIMQKNMRGIIKDKPQFSRCCWLPQIIFMMCFPCCGLNKCPSSIFGLLKFEQNRRVKRVSGGEYGSETIYKGFVTL